MYVVQWMYQCKNTQIGLVFKQIKYLFKLKKKNGLPSKAKQPCMDLGFLHYSLHSLFARCLQFLSPILSKATSTSCSHCLRSIPSPHPTGFSLVANPSERNKSYYISFSRYLSHSFPHPLKFLFFYIAINFSYFFFIQKLLKQRFGI